MNSHGHSFAKRLKRRAVHSAYGVMSPGVRDVIGDGGGVTVAREDAVEVIAEGCGQDVGDVGAVEEVHWSQMSLIYEASIEPSLIHSA